MQKVIPGIGKLEKKIEDLQGVDLGEMISFHPHGEMLMQGANFIGKVVNYRKIVDAWNCIANGEDEEKSINELYNYVSSEERAFYVSTAFRKMILTNSRIPASIIAYILGEISRANREFCQDDVVLFNVLENMTDFDIRNFEGMVDEKYTTLQYGKEYLDVEKFPEDKKEQYMELIELCEKQRLFGKETSSIEMVDEHGKSFFKTDIYLKNPANKLKKYIFLTRQILDYGRKISQK